MPPRPGTMPGWSGLGAAFRGKVPSQEEDTATDTATSKAHSRGMFSLTTSFTECYQEMVYTPMIFFGDAVKSPTDGSRSR